MRTPGKVSNGLGEGLEVVVEGDDCTILELCVAFFKWREKGKQLI